MPTRLSKFESLYPTLKIVTETSRVYSEDPVVQQGLNLDRVKSVRSEYFLFDQQISRKEYLLLMKKFVKIEEGGDSTWTDQAYTQGTRVSNFVISKRYSLMKKLNNRRFQSSQRTFSLPTRNN